MPKSYPEGAIRRTSLLVSSLLSGMLQSWAAELYGAPPPDIDDRIEALVSAYPDWIANREGNFLVLKDNRKFQISDGKTTKTFEQLLENPDIANMFYVPYPAGSAPQAPARNSDPGRIRFDPLFVTMYGDCAKNEVSRNLRIIEWLPKHTGGRVTVTKTNGVDRALEAASRELDGLPLDMMKYLKPNSGTYNCRTGAGSNVRSMHAYAAAIDINTQYSNYWRWSSPDTEPKWKNHIPTEIVQAFERHGFIWGGYWYHYDTMHFEYRPEFLPAVQKSKTR
jgi:D-alanyl-D-alanine carboxypeptidase